uniref:Small ribosomal subunit protein uS9c n=1 Tax=Roundia cardiophora TaxID=1403802 RepID=A0A089VNI5_9STRA|nr:ribosomal protein S9 [Roundia cardiophora]AIR75925.1 ribosomal protein S9 [Roundia cardiophora]
MNTVFRKNNIGLGKRKRAIARVFLIPGDGKVIINKVSGEKYLQYNPNYLEAIWLPLKKLNLETQFDIIAIVKGGGLTGQTDAIKLGVARLVCKMNNENRLILKPFGLLSRDARIKERKKYGLRKARKASQYSKR